MRRLLAATLLVVGAACGGDASQRPLEASGTYLLQTVNGAPLPFIIQASAPKIELLSDQLVLSAGGSFSDMTHERTTDGTAVTMDAFTTTGTRTVNGAALALRASDGSQLTGALTTDGTLTLSSTGVSALYRKQ